MPNIPVTWLEGFSVSTSNSTYDPDILQLANGNILVSWTTIDNAAAPNTGTDLMGQIFDPLGNPVGSAVVLNNSWFSDDERNGDLAAMSDGGFLIAYEDSDGSTDLRVERYNAAGTNIGFASIIQDGAGAPSFSDPHIAVSSATSAMITYVKTSGDPTIVAKIYNPTTGTVGTEFNLIAYSGGDFSPDVAVLSNGNYVVTGTRNVGADDQIIYRIISSTGTSVLGVTAVTATVGDTFSQSDASVTALAGGGFVIAYTNPDVNDTDVSYRVYNSAGTQVGSGEAGVDPGSITNDNNEQVVTGLPDGSFVIVLDNDNKNQLEATHVSATGAVLGTFVFEGHAGTTPAVTALKDGRLAVTWQEESTLAVKMEILDTRDFINSSAVYTPNGMQIGTIGDDVFTANVSGTIVHGWTGNDTITESGLFKSYFGDEGNDKIFVKSEINFDVHDGGAGTDTIDWSGSGVVGGSFKLGSGTATSGSSTETMVNFENLVGTSGNDLIFGTFKANRLVGGDGNDKLIGGEGKDKLYGGKGNDTYYVDNKGDKISEANGNGHDLVISTVSFTIGTPFEDLKLTGTSNIHGTGNTHANTITGNAGHNVLAGNGGSDTFVFATSLTPSNFDTITDFNSNDQFDIDNAVFKGLSTGNLSAGAFKQISSGNSTQGVDSGDRILYDKAHGDLYYDRDGSGNNFDRVKFAHIDNGTALNHSDFHVI
jgi:Ca2+-binding RTX toxin-like protein